MQLVDRERKSWIVCLAAGLIAFGVGAWLSAVVVAVEGGEDYHLVGVSGVRGLLVACTLVAALGVIGLVLGLRADGTAGGLCPAGSAVLGLGLGMALVAFQFYATAGTYISDNGVVGVEPSTGEYLLVLLGGVLGIVGAVAVLVGIARRRPPQEAHRSTPDRAPTA